MSNERSDRRRKDSGRGRDRDRRGDDARLDSGWGDEDGWLRELGRTDPGTGGGYKDPNDPWAWAKDRPPAPGWEPTGVPPGPGGPGWVDAPGQAAGPGDGFGPGPRRVAPAEPSWVNERTDEWSAAAGERYPGDQQQPQRSGRSAGRAVVRGRAGAAPDPVDESYNADPRLADPSATDPHMPDPRAPHPISPVDGPGPLGRGAVVDGPPGRGAPAGREAAFHDERGRGPIEDDRRAPVQDDRRAPAPGWAERPQSPAGPGWAERPQSPAGPGWAGRPQSPAGPDWDDRPQSRPGRRSAPPGREAAFHDERGAEPWDRGGRPPVDSGRRGPAGPVSPGYAQEPDPRQFPDERRRPAGPPRQVDRPAALHDETRRGRPYDDRDAPFDDGPRRADRPGGWDDRRGGPPPGYRDEPVSPAYPDEPVRRGEPPARDRHPESDRRPRRDERPAAFRQPGPPPPYSDAPEGPRRDERPAAYRDQAPPRHAPEGPRRGERVVPFRAPDERRRDERPAARHEPPPYTDAPRRDDPPAAFREPVPPPFTETPPRVDRRPAERTERLVPPSLVDDLPTTPLSPPPPRQPERLEDARPRAGRDGGTPEPWLVAPPPPFVPELGEPARPAEPTPAPPTEVAPAAQAATGVRVPAPRTGDSAPAYPRRISEDELHAARTPDETPLPEPAPVEDPRGDKGWFAAAITEPAEPVADAAPAPADEPEPAKAVAQIEPGPIEPEPAQPEPAQAAVATEPAEPPAPLPAEPVEATTPAEPEPTPGPEPEPIEATEPADPVPAAEPVEPLKPALPKPPVVDGLRLDLHQAIRPVSAPPAEPAAEPTAEPENAAPADDIAETTVPADAATDEPAAVEDARDETVTAEPTTTVEQPPETAEADPAPADSTSDDTGAATSPVSPDEPEATAEPEPASEPEATTDPETTPEPEPTTAADPEPTPEASADTVLPVPEGTAAGAATALRAPTMLHPVVAPEADEDGDEPQPKDPEQVLAGYQWRFHHETLRELVEDPDELRAIRDQLTAKLETATDNASRARLLSLRAVVSRILGDLGKALADGKLALAHAEATGELRRIAIAQARLAHVLQWRGDYAEADRLNALANSPELPDRLRATMHEHAGRSCYDQGRYIEACNHFEKALDLRKMDDPELIARTEQALDAVLAKVATNGLGPYPRDEEEILQLQKPPKPMFSEKVQRWGYVDAAGDWAIAPSYAEVQPFKEGVAWVRRPETEPWELIDESGEVRLFASLGYLGVGSFHDGLAWVSHNGRGNWLAIDKSGDVAINIGFEDVRPFRGGVAAVKRGAWGAIDKSGRTVLPPQYTGFATALTDGRYVDGFTDEGLAVVDSGGRKGVVDRNGRVLVPPRFPALVIHPVAFLVGGGQGLWGALDRRGEPLIDIVHGSRAAVTEEIDRLLADTKPVL